MGEVCACLRSTIAIPDIARYYLKSLVMTRLSNDQLVSVTVNIIAILSYTFPFPIYLLSGYRI
ncbi:hypothetical protein KIN20_020854 [Parelaphostrongylus tenuis]|uniref:Uncharacterized protein n=1 Tax=Parelaphostrongylus tenuis TaxID=148309 RepID=A0AAD5NAA2_PARTN|nr:hypothetical protein KIN20_020854 [Parelaphostrongylus tenuis]